MGGMEDLDERGARLKSVLGDRAIAWLAKQVGVAASTVHGYINGKVPPADVAFLICDVLEMDLRWWILGDGPSTGRSDRLVSVPLVEADGTTAFDVSYSVSFLSELKVEASSVRCLLAIGASMAPTVPEHSEVLYTSQVGEPADGEVFVIAIRGRSVLRRLRIRANGAMETVCDNPAFRSEAADEVREDQILGRVLWVSHRPH